MPEAPSIMQWWIFVISAKRSPPSRPSTSQFSQSGRRRSSGCDMTRAESRFSCAAVPGFGSAVWRMWKSRLKRGSSTHDRVLEAGDPVELLPVARDAVEHGLGRALEALDVDAAVGGAERTDLEDQRGRHVHVHVRRLEEQERVVLRGQAVVAVAGHGGSPREELPFYTRAASPSTCSMS